MRNESFNKSTGAAIKSEYESHLALNKQIDRLVFISERFSEVMAEYFSTLSGTCYMQGHCLTEVLIRNGYKAKKVTGKLALLIKNTNGKYAIYGQQRLKGILIGNYHTWCEVETEFGTIILDTTTKNNVSYLKQILKIKIDPRISGNIVTGEKDCFLYKYLDDINLESHSTTFLNRVDYQLVEKVIHETCVRLM